MKINAVDDENDASADDAEYVVLMMKMMILALMIMVMVMDHVGDLSLIHI